MPQGPVARLVALASEAPYRPALRRIGGSIRGGSRERDPDHDENVVTRSELLEGVARTAAALRALGVDEEDLVALVLPNSAELVMLHYALWSLGACAVVISPLYTPFEIARCLDDSQPAGLIGLSPQLGLLVHSGQSLPRLRFMARVDEMGQPGAPPWLYERGTALAPVREPRPDSLATVHFTYKGIGYALGAKHTYEHYARGVDALVKFYRPRPEYTALCALPLSHVYAITSCMLAPLYAGASAAIVKSSRPQLVLRYAQAHGANVICLVPTVYRLLAICARRAKGADLRACHWVTGGSYMSRELHAELDRDFGVRPLQGYGMTEALIVTASNWENDRPGSLGIPLFRDTEITILDEAGRELPRGAVGEVAIRAPTVMTGYLGRREETSRFLRDGRFLTGDLGSLDADGFLHFAGRRARFAKVAGLMVDLVEVERAITSHPAVASCLMTTEPDDLAGELVRAAVTLRPGAELGLSKLVEHCCGQLASYKVPKSFRFVRTGSRASRAFDESRDPS